MLTDVIQFIFIGEVNERYHGNALIYWENVYFSVIATMPKW